LSDTVFCVWPQVFGDAMYVYGGRGPKPLGDFWMLYLAA
jgi:hypothetical protein